MMNQFCSHCNVQLEEFVSHCPLCGKCVNEANVNKNMHENFPSGEVFRLNKQKAYKAATSLLMLGNLLCLFIEFLLFWKISWSLHVLVASIFTFFGIIRPIYENWRLVNYHSVFYIMFTGYIVFLENYTQSFGWGIGYVIPLFAFTFAIYNFIMILTNIKNRSDYILPMFILLTISIICFSFNYVNKLTLWPSMLSFLTLLSFTVISFVFQSSKILRALAKKFHI